MRTPQQVAKRALVATCLAFRASLEATEHPRSAGISANLLPWLVQHGIADELDPIEREILETPYRQLRKDQQTDVNWSGEAAWIFAWALELVEKPPPSDIVDYRILAQRLEVLRSDPGTFIARAALRSEAELAAFCVETLAIRTELQKLRISGGPVDVLDQVLSQRLSHICLGASNSDVRQAREFAHGLTEDERRAVAGMYFVRDYAATWLFDDRPTYFASALGNK